MNLNFSANMAGFCRDSHKCQMLVPRYCMPLSIYVIITLVLQLESQVT